MNALFMSIYVFITGLAVGSFLNVLIDRLANDRTINGRSKCDFCNHILHWNDLIPVFSFLFLKGKCRYCNKKLSFQYPLIEILTAFLFTVFWSQDSLSGFTVQSKLVILGIVCTFIVIFFADVKYRIIPDSMQVVLFILAIAWYVVHGINPVIFLNQVLAAFIVMTPILLIHLLTRGRGMGFGDVKLAFIFGFLVGVKAGLLVLYAAFVFGALFGIALILLKKKKLKSKIAFGPFLIVGLALVSLFREPIFAFLTQIYGI